MKKYLIPTAILIFSALLLFALITIYFVEYSYKYTCIHNVSDFGRYTIVNVVVAATPLVCCLFFLVFKKKVLFWICIALFFPLFLFSSVKMFQEILFSPTICSYTEDVSNLGHYDDELAKTLTLNSEFYPELRMFPDCIPPNAQDVQYAYFYQKASSDIFSISLSWEYDQQDYLEALADFSEYESVTDNGKIIFQFPQDHSEENAAPFFLLEVWFQQDENRISYFLRSKTGDGLGTGGRFCCPR